MVEGKSKAIARYKAGPDHEVVTVQGGSFRYRCRVCNECPWRRDQPVERFPAEAFRISAPTAYDMAQTAFACHMEGTDRAVTCAGFLQRGASHNMLIRIRLMKRDLDPDDLIHDVELYESYRKMAEANGVSEYDPVLARCR